MRCGEYDIGRPDQFAVCKRHSSRTNTFIRTQCDFGSGGVMRIVVEFSEFELGEAIAIAASAFEWERNDQCC